MYTEEGGYLSNPMGERFGAPVPTYEKIAAELSGF